MIYPNQNEGGPVFIMLVGLPASGKSTYLEKMPTEDFVVLSTDNIVEARAAEIGATYDDVWADYIKIAEAEMRFEFSKAVKAGSNIVLDRTNLSRKKRMGFLSQLPSEYFKIAVVCERPDNAEWARRLASRKGKTIPSGVLFSMEATAVFPELSEGWDLIKMGPSY